MTFIENILAEFSRIFKKNRSITYSAILIFAIPAILFATSYYSMSQFEKSFNHLIQTKGLLLEQVFVDSLKEDDNDLEKIQEKIQRIIADNQDVEELKILEIGKSEKGNKILASSNQDEIGEFSEDPKEFLAIGIPEGIAGIVAEDGVRFWEIAKKVEINNDQNVIIKTRLSLYNVDKAFNRSISRTYWSVILASVVVTLLAINYVRLTQYVLMYKKIKEVDEMKDDFISMTSHELKTPLTAINGYLDLLSSAKSKLTKDEQHYLDNIQASSTRLKTLVSDILEVSRIEQGRISFEYSDVLASEIPEKVINTLSSRAKEKGLKLVFDNQLANQKALINVDPDRLQQIIVNLVGNSIKYTEKGAIDVIVSQDGPRIKIAVEDTGIGMNSAERESIFKKFSRVKNSQTSQIEGTGLGLWITKELVEQMKGEIFVESIKDRGSRFFVIFEESIKK